MASAIRLATERTLRLGSSAWVVALRGMLLVVTSSLSTDLLMRAQAGSDKIGWVAQAITSVAPAAMITLAASVIVPAVSIMSSINRAIQSRTSPTRFISATSLARW